MAAPIRLAVVGLGKIARDQHLPAIAADPAFRLVATVDPAGPGIGGVAHYADLAALFDSRTPIDAAVFCTPPQVRHALASAALDRGLAVFLEKPPGATLSEVVALEARAVASGATLFAGWHSRFAAGVAPAEQWLADRRIERVTITWREDVRVWHPGQHWIWQPGGLGVFDPGINALSILTAILPQPWVIDEAALDVPANCAAPIAARLKLRSVDGVPASTDFDFRQTGPQTWDIVIGTDAGECRLSHGGAVLSLPTGERQGENREYARLYARFADLIRQGRSDVDSAPFRLVADAFLCGRQTIVDAFHP